MVVAGGAARQAEEAAAWLGLDRQTDRQTEESQSWLAGCGHFNSQRAASISRFLGFFVVLFLFCFGAFKFIVTEAPIVQRSSQLNFFHDRSATL